MSHTIKTKTTTSHRIAVVAAAAAIAAGALTGAASPAAAADGPGSRTLRALCQADGGISFTGRFGDWRCQQAGVDGMGGFWAEERVCVQAGRLFFRTVDESTGTGSWSCAPTSI